MNSPAIVFYTSDFLTGVSNLTMEERGQYITLLCLQHQLGHLNLKTINLNINNLSQDVLNKFIVDEDGNYYNKRLELEIEKRDKFIKHQSENGKKGGRPKKTKKNPKKNQNENENEPKKKPLENENDNDNENINIIKEIINYLNLRIGSNYKYTTKATQKLINARLKDGYSLENFKVVIDKKVDEWLDTDMAQYLRPSTLFAGKFDEYLNQQGKKKEITTSDIAKNMNWEEFFNE